MFRNLFVIISLVLFVGKSAEACSILYYVDTKTGKIYVANNEDYWYNVKPYIKIFPAEKNNLARLWYGWDNFSQGGINEAGLFFDGASTPEEKPVSGYSKPKGNLGDEILAKCKTVNEAVDYLEQHKIALTNGHLLFGDKTGNAVVVEWVAGKRNLIPISDNKLMITNFLISDTAKGNFPCPRYEAMEQAIENLRKSNDSIDLKQIGNIAAKAVQTPSKNADGKEGGTLYSTFIDITDMKMIVVPKLNNKNMRIFDLKNEFSKQQKQTFKMKNE